MGMSVKGAREGINVLGASEPLTSERPVRFPNAGNAGVRVCCHVLPWYGTLPLQLDFGGDATLAESSDVDNRQTSNACLVGGAVVEVEGLSTGDSRHKSGRMTTAINSSTASPAAT